MDTDIIQNIPYSLGSDGFTEPGINVHIWSPHLIYGKFPDSFECLRGTASTFPGAAQTSFRTECLRGKRWASGQGSQALGQPTETSWWEHIQSSDWAARGLGEPWLASHLQGSLAICGKEKGVSGVWLLRKAGDSPGQGQEYCYL